MIAPLIAALLSTASPNAIERAIFPFPTPLLAIGASATPTYPDYAYAENPSGVATTSSTPVSLATISGFATDPAAHYLIIWNSQVSGTSASSGQDVEMNVDGGGFLSASTSWFTTSTDQRTHCGIYVFAGDGSAHSFTVTGDNTAGTSTFINSSIFVLKLGPNDVYAAGISQTATSATLADMLSITFTPPSARDYLVLGFSAMGSNSTAHNADMALNDGTNTYEMNMLISGSNQSTRHPFLIMEKLSGISGSHTVKLQKACTGGSGIATFNYPHLVILDLSRFADVQYAVLGSNNAGTNTSYTTALTETFTAAAAKYLTLGAGVILGSVTTTNTSARFVDAGAVLTESVQGAFSIPMSAMKVQTLSSGSRTQTIDRKSATSSVTATVWANLASIVNISLAGLVSA